MNALLMALTCKYLLALLSKITIINGITCFSIYYWHYASLLIGTTVYTSSYWHYQMNALLMALLRKYLLALLSKITIINGTTCYSMLYTDVPYQEQSTAVITMTKYNTLLG